MASRKKTSPAGKADGFEPGDSGPKAQPAAAAPIEGDRKPQEVEVLVFEVAGRRYGLPVSQVREVLQAVTLTPLPSASPVVEGLMNVRGDVVPVLDIRGRFGLPIKAPEHTDSLIVAWAGERQVALRADRATGLARFADVDVVDAKHVVPDNGCVAGVAKLPDGLLLLLDLPTLIRPWDSAAV